MQTLLWTMPSAFATVAAAGVAAAVELSIMQPLDVIKTQLQTGHATCGALAALRRAHASDGLHGLWRGFGPGLAIVVPRRGLKFVANERYSSWFGKGPIGSLAAGAAAGASEAVVITPLEVLKVQMQSPRGTRTESVLHIARALWQRGGLMPFYTGLGATVAKHSAHSMVYFASFRRTQSGARSIIGSHVGGDLVAGLFAGVAAGTVNNPFDVVKSRQQVRAQCSTSTHGLCSGLAHVVRRKGVQALFSGWRAKVARLGPGSGIIFAVYHAVLERFPHPW